jgi:hypothetical protein
VQCNSWGHPDTSGFPTLDYYLSSDLMEPPDAQDHYTEQLVRLPNLSIYYETADARPILLNRKHLGLRPTATVYWCGQSVFKYLPQFDQIFPRITEKLGDCQFVFIRYHTGSYINELFRKRLDRAFSAFGLKAADYCIVLPRLDPDRFVAAIGQCDIFLDSIGWSGCNSTLESLRHDLPIVTMTGPLMRGRHTMAILKMMGVTETITETIEDYVSTAVRLAQDDKWRLAVKNRISKNKHRLCRDTTCVRALEEFLDRVARRSPETQYRPIDAASEAGGHLSDPRREVHADLQGRQLQAEEAKNARSAERVLEIVFRYYQPASVLDVGCGLGTWLKVAAAIGVRDIHGMDGPWLDLSRLQIDPRCVEMRDLEQGFDLGRRFDLVICLEVAEHLVPSAAEGFIAALTRHAPAVLFSAAIPYQGWSPSRE